ncbi:hypothetical protein [Nocardioides limicola]|uniref:hypothetical protein n=1 Tax=Nocardioides limicola TaxID=2803368 RepID=UPI00193BEC03|nr:hypothetical protein [Nocardioides sp. DJM-14]
MVTSDPFSAPATDPYSSWLLDRLLGPLVRSLAQPGEPFEVAVLVGRNPVDGVSWALIESWFEAATERTYESVMEVAFGEFPGHPANDDEFSGAGEVDASKGYFRLGPDGDDAPDELRWACVRAFGERFDYALAEPEMDAAQLNAAAADYVEELAAWLAESGGAWGEWRAGTFTPITDEELFAIRRR